MKHLIAEFTEQTYTQIIFPHEKTDWHIYLQEAQETFENIINQIIKYQKCLVVCADIEDVKHRFQKNKMVGVHQAITPNLLMAMRDQKLYELNDLISRKKFDVALARDSGSVADLDQRGAELKKLNEKGCKLMLSNSYHPEFFRELCGGFNIKKVVAKRMINSKGDKRKNDIYELLIMNY